MRDTLGSTIKGTRREQHRRWQIQPCTCCRCQRAQRGVLQCQETGLALRLVTNITVFLHGTWHFGTVDN